MRLTLVQAELPDGWPHTHVAHLVEQHTVACALVEPEEFESAGDRIAVQNHVPGVWAILQHGGIVRAGGQDEALMV